MTRTAQSCVDESANFSHDFYISKPPAMYRYIRPIHGVRAFSSGRVCWNIKPSNEGMKSTESWGSQDNLSSITSRMVGMTKQLQDTTEPPVHIDSAFTKKFSAGSTYDPFDFSKDRLDMDKRHRTKNATKTDPFEKAGVDPRDLYTMPEILSRFLTSAGQILPRDITGCNSKNQKKLGIAIKRARAAGLLSTTHKSARFLPIRNL